MIEKTLRSFLEEHSCRGMNLCAAVSGGADSTAMIHGLATLRDEFSLFLRAVHVNYNLRESESRRDEDHVRAMCRALNIPLRVESVTSVSPAAAGIEEQARKIRYALFQQIAETTDSRIVLGHTRDDQAETLLFRLARGTGIRGAAGMAPLRYPVIRPLLRVSRTEIVRWLEKNAIPWQEDSSNRENHFRRNLIRNRIIPLLEEVNPRASQHLADFTFDLQPLRAEQEEEGRFFQEQAIRSAGTDLYLLDKAALLAQKAPASCLNMFFTDIHCPAGREQIQTIIDLCRRTSGARILLPGPFACRVLSQTVFICRGELPQKQRDSMLLHSTGSVSPNVFSSIETAPLTTSPRFDRTNTRVYIPKELFPLTLRRIQPDDTLCPFGSEKPVFAIQLLKKAGLSAFERENHCIVTDSSNTPLWLPGAAFSRKARLRGTEQAVECRWKSLFRRVGKDRAER
ncbi:MAG: tRNA lysidine(34) synthetase TilS [Fibrobacterota bacterium]